MWEYTFGKNDLISGNIDLSGINISAGDRVVISEENCKTFGNSTGKSSQECGVAKMLRMLFLILWL